jgi:hypothetical protein
MVGPAGEIEAALLVPGSPEALAAVHGPEPLATGARIRLVFAMLGLLGIAAVLLVWGLLR